MSFVTIPSPITEDVLMLLKEEQIDQTIYHDAIEIKRIMQCYSTLKQLLNGN